jgi:hypothetical protein
VQLLVPALVLLDLFPDQLVVLAEESVGLSVTEPRPERGRTLDVREHDGHGTFGEIRQIHRRHPTTGRHRFAG